VQPAFPLEFWVVLLGFGFGYWISRSFKHFDRELQKTRWFKRRSDFAKWFLKQLLNCFHHFQIGILLIILSFYLPDLWKLFFFNFGLALILDDLKDIPPRFRKHLDKLLKQ